MSLYANPLQDAIDSAAPYDTIKLSNGTYSGNIIINKPLTIVGEGENVIIKGSDEGRVITIKSHHVHLNSLIITDSGSRMENLDAAIFMDQVSYCKIEHCHIKESLYGIDMKMVTHSVIRNNTITSKKNDISLRGDGLKLWYSHHNIIQNNTINNVRDVTLTRSSDNKIKNNTFLNNRYGLHLSLSHHNNIEKNTFKYNSVALMIMGAKDINVTNNIIESSIGAAGIGVVIKGVSNFHFKKNQVRYNAQGIYVDTKSTETGMQRYFINNDIAYNKEALHFHAIIKNNTITNNRVYGNIDDIVRDSKVNPSNSNVIEYNYWDRYAGFDKNGDNIGDTAHKVYLYADQLWQFNHKIKFFYASPIMSLINFLTNIAPFIEPTLLLEDTKPIICYNSTNEKRDKFQSSNTIRTSW
jgi:nitrous oxidase accessory protein